jgi:hypothetical protein
MSKELAKTYDPKAIEENCMKDGVRTSIFMRRWTEAENRSQR